ncbi:AbrB/MazE/SpoVT family DNA-binding domain-containing protein [Infirmifilum sp. NZ]|uniref:AbrB/MazE/SpoVT family DNA-binding domain-containing protein n=1 Tax=Infirmifilum sp. NZ TaxID=2926850 RepID=UPI00279ACF8A|nr:AbrB/MazE/SpoVT family DNA-binding domain-containing protein [Infirmifilum sp. NZ]UNQ72533.1 AbrB/MazE/SpoVT family DNA-binding domain-containing protein [Infirmifilum sp. NZ]
MGVVMAERRRGVKGLGIESLPYRIKMYSNNQVLVPASLVRKLGLRDVVEAQVTIRYAGLEHTFTARLLKTKYTDSRQFTLPKELREKLSIPPGAEVEVVSIKPLKVHE